MKLVCANPACRAEGPEASNNLGVNIQAGWAPVLMNDGGLAHYCRRCALLIQTEARRLQKLLGEGNDQVYFRGLLRLADKLPK